jgi:hypothetical protein
MFVCIRLNALNNIIANNHAQERVLVAPGALQVTLTGHAAIPRSAAILRLLLWNPRIPVANLELEHL